MAKNNDKEFQGYVKAKLEDISSDIKEIKDNYKTQISNCNIRFKGIENDVGANKLGLAKIGVIIGGISIFASIIITKIINTIFK